jgi:hypothetical protein
VYKRQVMNLTFGVKIGIQDHHTVTHNHPN